MRTKLPSLTDLAGAWWVKPLLYVLLAGLVVFAARSMWGSVHDFLFGDPKVIQAHGEAVAADERAEGAAQAATEGMQVVVRVEQEHAAIDKTTRSNDYAIKHSEGASGQAPGVADALRRSVCLRDAHRADPECAALQGDGGGVGPAGPDPWR